MGYEINSPVKQVWLPLDQEWMGQVTSGFVTFGVFAKQYKEKYGIDLHDILEMKTNNGSVLVISKVDLLGAYNVPSKNFNIWNTKMACPNAIRDITFADQPASDKVTLMTIAFNDHGENFYVGFNILLPDTEVNSIDDLLVGIFEI